MKQLIIEAINNKKLVSFNYKEDARVVEPYCYGVTVKGAEALRAFQVSGYSASQMPGWKLFHLSNISSLHLLEEKFIMPRHDYKRGDKGMKLIYSEL